MLLLSKRMLLQGNLLAEKNVSERVMQ